MNGKKRTILVLLVVFLAAACHGPFLGDLPSEPEYWAIDARGTPLYVYLDDDYNVLEQSGPDTGKTAVFVVENPQAEGVIVLAEQTPGYDDAVYIVNRNTDTIISMFFHEDQRFPWQIKINDGNGGSAEARLFGYDWSYERFSLEFEENSINTSAEDIRLSRDALLSYQFNPALAREQNIRLRNTYAALAVYESISRTFPNNGKIFLNADNAGGVLASAFTDKSLAAFAVAVKPARPMIPAAEYASDESPAYFFNTIVDWILGLLGLGGGSSTPPPPLSVAITTSGVPVNPEAIYYIEKGEEIIFDFKFTNFTQSTIVNAALYEPDLHIYTYFHDLSPTLSYTGFSFSFTQEDGSPLGRFKENYRLKVRRNSLTGYWNQGRIAVAIFFGQNTIINNSASGISFHEPGSSMPELNKSVFVLQFTVFPEGARQ